MNRRNKYCAGFFISLSVGYEIAKALFNHDTLLLWMDMLLYFENC